jgi:N-acetylmuramoyl-L-alanine amidase
MNNSFLNFIFSLAFSICFSTVTTGNNRIAEKDESRVSVVVIDPGHGGKDWGASMGRAKEKDIVLDIALKLGEIIKTNYPDIKIVYTRSKDVFIPLHQRANIANKNKADLFISIHVNAVEQKSVQGTETFVLGQHRSKDNLEVAKKENSVILLEDDYNKTYEGFDPNSPESYIMFELVQDEYLEQSVMFASAIQKEFKERVHRADRSVKQAGFLVLRRTTMPSVLIETGFLSNTAERSYLLSESGQTSLASAIFRAFSVYKKKIEEKSSFNLITDKSADKQNNNNNKQAATIKAKPTTQKTINKPKSDIYFSVQIIALKKKLETTPQNFKGEKNIFIVESENINRYFSGKFNSPEEAEKEKKRIQKKYKNAFVVAFEKNKLISVKKALLKM